MRNLKVVEGSHFDENEKEWKKGEVLVGPEWLVRVFPGKFEDLGPATRGPVLVQNLPETTPAGSPAGKEEPATKRGRPKKLSLEEVWGDE